MNKESSNEIWREEEVVDIVVKRSRKEGISLNVREMICDGRSLILKPIYRCYWIGGVKLVVLQGQVVIKRSGVWQKS